jgi:hypothetical protein
VGGGPYQRRVKRRHAPVVRGDEIGVPTGACDQVRFGEDRLHLSAVVERDVLLVPAERYEPCLSQQRGLVPESCVHGFDGHARLTGDFGDRGPPVALRDEQVVRCPHDPQSRLTRLFIASAGVVLPLDCPDPAVDEAVRAARAPFLETDDVALPDGAPPGRHMQWPGTELQRSEWFTDVRQSVIARRLTMSARDYVGHLSTISAYLQLPTSEQEQVYDRIMQVLPERVEVAADITVHLGRRRLPCQRGGQAG